ncbi:MAG: hypothetical protein ACLFQU_08620 [Candidatus Kapaibacterium sp.]
MEGRSFIVKGRSSIEALTGCFLLLAIALLVNSCASINADKQLPPGNAAGINTRQNETAPAQGIAKEENADPCFYENIAMPADTNFGIKNSVDYFEEISGFDTGNQLDAVYFMTENEGFFSYSHPPAEFLSELNKFPVKGVVGGTDIFYFNYEKGRNEVHNLGDSLNTKFWDSHAYGVEDASGNVLLIWASDRPDYLTGFGSPFSKHNRLLGDDTLKGNTDLYYAFRSPEGKWGRPRNFAELGYGINSEKNDETPFLYCLCHHTKLLFSSNRGNDDYGDYDIYMADVAIDMQKQEIKVLSAPRMLDKGENRINTTAKEFFPFIPKPYPDFSDTSAVHYIYFSSDRYRKNPPEKGSNSDNSDFENIGGFDFYKFPFSEPCRAPFINYELAIVDTLNPGRPVKKPLLQVFDGSTGDVRPFESRKASMTLRYGRKYHAEGQSLFNDIECEGKEKTISNYALMEILEKEPEIISREVATKVDTVLPLRTVTITDTLIKNIRYPIEKIGSLQPEEGQNILSIETENDSIHIVMREIKTRDSVISERKTTIKKNITVYDTTRIFDTIYHPSYQVMKASKLTLRGGYFPTKMPLMDTLIYDTVFVYPDYYYFPPCRWEYINHLDEYRRNIPYFMTGFWEVNTPENLSNHLTELKKFRYRDASFIELHPENQYFGYERGTLDDEAKEARLRKYRNRAWEYSKFAETVDQNLKEMAHQIAGEILPSFDSLEKKAPELNSRLFIQIEGYSDIRPIKRGEFISDEAVFYIAGEFDNSINTVNMETVSIAPGESLVGTDNRKLSALRAYFGYKDLYERLMEYELFRKYVESELVLTSTNISNENDFYERLEDAKVVILVNGKQIDPSVEFEIPGYVGKEGDYRELDAVRRINVIIKRLEYRNGGLQNPPCCREVD